MTTRTKKRTEIVRRGDVLGLDARGQIVRPGEVGYNGHWAFVRGSSPRTRTAQPKRSK